MYDETRLAMNLQNNNTELQFIYKISYLANQKVFFSSVVYNNLQPLQVPATKCT